MKTNKPIEKTETLLPVLPELEGKTIYSIHLSLDYRPIVSLTFNSAKEKEEKKEKCWHGFLPFSFPSSAQNSLDLRNVSMFWGKHKKKDCVVLFFETQTGPCRGALLQWNIEDKKPVLFPLPQGTVLYSPLPHHRGSWATENERFLRKDKIGWILTTVCEGYLVYYKVSNLCSPNCNQVPKSVVTFQKSDPCSCSHLLIASPSKNTFCDLKISILDHFFSVTCSSWKNQKIGRTKTIQKEKDLSLSLSLSLSPFSALFYESQKVNLTEWTKDIEIEEDLKGFKAVYFSSKSHYLLMWFPANSCSLYLSSLKILSTRTGEEVYWLKECDGESFLEEDILEIEKQVRQTEIITFKERDYLIFQFNTKVLRIYDIRLGIKVGVYFSSIPHFCILDNFILFYSESKLCSVFPLELWMERMVTMY